MKAVVLVPWRGGEPVRERAWSIALPYLLDIGWPVHLGDVEGPWNRSAACNAAAAAAGEWDVAVVADADTIQEPETIAEAARHAYRTGVAVVPWDRRYKLSEAGTARLVHVDVTDLTEADVEPSELTAAWNQPEYPAWRCGSTIVIPRDAWETVGGFDEGFSIWGHEDCANRLALRTLVGLERLPGRIWHLWHPPASGRIARNRNRFRRYKHADGNVRAMGALLDGLGVR